MSRKLKPTTRIDDRRLRIAAVIALVVVTLLVYVRATGFGFQLYHDDEYYVTQNEHVVSGLTGPSIAWAFTNSYAANWHPLTWMSHMLDCDLYGTNAGGHHATSILLHIANTLLLLLAMHRMTRRFWPSAFVAAMFALHPLHVESVAWVAERKDVLSTFFMFLTILAYLKYAEKPTVRGFILVAVAYMLGLLAKPMLVTLPVLLILLDWWPLGRFGKRPARKLLIEKLPLLALAAGSCYATFVAQSYGGAVQSLGAYSLASRLATAPIAYAEYVIKMLWPSNLAALYPHPVGGWPAWQVAASMAFLAITTGLVIRRAKKSPYLLVGWAWYVITLVPVIGLVQVGEQAYADRYTYVPLIGLFVMVAWTIGDAMSRVNSQTYTKLISGLAILILTVCSVATFMQVGVWKDSPTLFEHAIEVVPGNYLAEHELGWGLARWDTRFAEAIPHMRRCVELKPRWAIARFNFAAVLYWNGDYREAAEELKIAEATGFTSNAQDVKDLQATIREAAKR